MKRALLVGINEYPDNENVLAACVNDVTDFALFLTNRCHFPYGNIKLLTERRATKFEILKGLVWLVKGLKSGDEAVFVYSGHGNHLATDDIAGHVDKYYECICPYDFDWKGKNNISDRDLSRVFSKIPDGVRFVWVSDSCYSGGLSELEEAPGELKGKRSRLPVEVARRVKSAIQANIQPMTMPGVVAGNNVILISATKERQQAQEKSFKQEIKINGLMVYFLLEGLYEGYDLDTPLDEVMRTVIENVKSYGMTSTPSFHQEPVLHGRPELDPATVSEVDGEAGRRSCLVGSARSGGGRDR